MGPVTSVRVNRELGKVSADAYNGRLAAPAAVKTPGGR
jgi:hypothetical protein